MNNYKNIIQTQQKLNVMYIMYDIIASLLTSKKQTNTDICTIYMTNTKK